MEAGPTAAVRLADAGRGRLATPSVRVRSEGMLLAGHNHAGGGQGKRESEKSNVDACAHVTTAQV